jgi:hypothetical protein
MPLSTRWRRQIKAVTSTTAVSVSLSGTFLLTLHMSNVHQEACPLFPPDLLFYII